MKLFKKIALVAVGATMAIGVGIGVIASNSLVKTEAVNYAAEADFTLKSASHSAYGDAWTYGSWSLFGAANNNGGWAFMKFGGKNTTLAAANPVYCRGQVATKAVSQIDVVTNSGTLPSTSMGVTQWGVHVYSDSGYSLLVDTVVGGTMTRLTAQTLSLIPSSSWPAGSYYEVFFDLTNTTTTNGIVWVDKIQFVEQVDLGKTLTDLEYTGTPETTIYNEGDDFDPTGITVTATYSDASNADVTSQIIWEDLVQGMTSVEGSYTYLSSTLTVEVTGLTVNAAPIIGGIVDGHAYLITAAKATTGDVNYVLKAGTAFAAGSSSGSSEIFTSAANYSISDAFVFTKVGVNEYQITSGSDYLSATNTNNGLVLGTTTDTWKVTEAVGSTPVAYNGVFLQDASQGRYLTVYATNPDFRTYTSTTGQPLPAACIVLYDMTVLNGYAASFNSTLGGVCVANGSSNVASLASAWSSVSSDFASLSAAQKAVFADTVNAVGDVAGTEIEQAIAKYEYVAAKYNTQLVASGWDFMARNITPASGSARLGEIADGNNLVVIALIAVSTLGILGGVFYFRKRKLA